MYVPLKLYLYMFHLTNFSYWYPIKLTYYFYISEIYFFVCYHSVNVPAPAFTIPKVNFHPDIHQTLAQLDYKEAKRIQVYSWQSLLRNHNMFIIHGPRTGKTLTYLPVMCTFILEKDERYQHVPKTGGPIVLILCSNSHKCEEIEFLMRVLFGKNRCRVRSITYPNCSAPLVGSFQINSLKIIKEKTVEIYFFNLSC